MDFRPGDIYWSHDFYGTDKHRVFIVSRVELNKGSYVVTILFTSRRLEERKNLPNCVFFPGGTQQGLDQDCVAQGKSISQLPIRYLDLESGCLGHVDDEKLAEVNQAINYVIDNVC